MSIITPETKKSSNIVLKPYLKDKLYEMFKKTPADSYNAFVNLTLERYTNLLEEFNENFIEEVINVTSHVKNEPIVIKKFYIKLLQDSIEKISNLKGESDEWFDIETSANLFRCLFTIENKESILYFGTSESTPSQYYFFFRKYLEFHEEMLNYRKQNNIDSNIKDTRFLIVSERALIDDYKYSPKKFAEFIKFHVENDVNLFFIDPTIVERLKNECFYKPLSSSFGFWNGKYSVQFRYHPPNRRSKNPQKLIGITLSFLGDKNYEATKELVEKIKTLDKSEIVDMKSFYEKLEKNRISNSDLFNVQKPTYSEEIISIWSEYSNRDRLKKSIPFLKSVIEERYGKKIFPEHPIRILDSAAGLGHECINLVKLGYQIVSNEPDKKLYKFALGEMNKKYGTIQPLNEEVGDYSPKILTMFDGKELLLLNEPWSLLKQSFHDNESFDVILAIGNVISQISSENKYNDNKNKDDDEKEIRERIGDLYEMLSPGGILVIDHRDFNLIENILDNVDNSIKSIHSRFKKVYSKQYNYCSNNIIGVPGPKINGKIPLNFIDNSRNEYKEIKGTEMIPLHIPEFLKILKDANFTDIRVYRNQEINNKINIDSPTCEKDNPSDFFVYIATKPM
jgi:hypothetical protein